MLFHSKHLSVLAALFLCALGGLTAQAQTTTITFSVDLASNIVAGSFIPGTSTITANGSYNGWGAGLNLIQAGSGTVYTNTAADTSDPTNGLLSYKFVLNGNYETTADFNNRTWQLPPTNGAAVVLPTPYYADGGAPVTNDVTFQVDMSQQINTGAFTDGSSTVEVRGNFNGWTGGANFLALDPSISITNQYGLVSSEVYTGVVSVVASPNAAMDYKFVLQPPNDSYETVTAPNSDSGGNRWFVNDGPQVRPVVYFGDAPYAPTAQVTFNVDMTVVALTDTNFNPASVTINGDVMGWGGTAMTNDPTAANTNIYTATFTIGEGSPVNYQYRYTQLSSGTTVYDHFDGANGGNNNRYYLVPNTTSTNLPAVYFNDASLGEYASQYITQPTPVIFTVDMTGAVGTDSHAFTTGDGLYINGQFANWYGWANGANPVSAPPGYQMMEVGDTLIYTNTIIIPAGTPVAFAYKYGIDENQALGGPADDEAASGQNHFRVVRSTAISPYPMAQDKFGNQYAEPYFNSTSTTGGQLSLGAVSGGHVPVSWLGRPGARLQTATNLLGPWSTLDATDGTNWTVGTWTTNGFLSTTNWPVGTNSYFRLIKP